MATGHETSEWQLGQSVRLGLQQQINEVCRRFETAWKAAVSTGRRPRISDYLSEEDEPGRPDLVRELILLDISYRRLAGDEPAAEEYLSLFPSLDRPRLDQALATPESPRLPSTVAYHPVVPKVQPGRYTTNRFHARGGMGEVWLAQDTEIGREVAVKRIRRDRVKQQERFLAEAQITGQLEHPSIVPVHDLGMDEEGQPFYVMKVVRGRTLKDAIEEYQAASNRKDPSSELQRLRLLEVFVDICQAVAYAHSRDVIHRDLKPDNVMLGEYGETIVLDWGLAKVLGHPEIPGGPSYVHVTSSGRGSETVDGAVMGAPPYMAPEVAEGHASDVDEKTDVYLLGATLYEILTGRPPRQGTSRDEIIELARTVSPVPPRQLNRAVPRALEAICLKAMARRKQARYATAKSLAEDVRCYLAGEPVSAYPESVLERSWRWAKRHRRGLSYAAVAIIVTSLGLFGFSTVREARLEAEQLKQQEYHRHQVKEFRRQADEAHFYAASTNPVAEHAPYFEPLKGETAAQVALQIADDWGDSLGRLTLPDQRESLKDELYNLVLIIVQLRMSKPSAKRDEIDKTRQLLDRAAALCDPTRSFYRLQAECLHRLGDRPKAADAQRQAEDPATRLTALDHFLLGEQFRTQAAPAAGTPADRPAWQPDSATLDKAIDEYRQALTIDPDHYWSHFQLGRCYMSLGRLPEAVEALGTCVALRPDSTWGYSARGFAQAVQGRWNDALQDLNRAIALDPDFRPARLNRGVVHWLKKDYPDALADFAAVFEPPDDKRLIEAAYYRGQVYLEQRKLEEALMDFDTVVDQKRDFRPVYLARARAYFLHGDDQKGMDDLTEYLRSGADEHFNPEDPAACYERGRFIRRLALRLPESARRKKLHLALTQLQKAVEHGARSAAIFDELGAVQDSLGKSDAAIDAYSDGIGLDPEHVALLEKRGWAYAQARQHEKAAEDFQGILRLKPQNTQEQLLQASAHSGLGWLHACQGEAPAAERQATLALAKVRGEKHWRIPFNVATIYAELSETKHDAAAEHQELAMAMLHSAADLANRAGAAASLRREMQQDPALKPLQNLPEFKQLLHDLDPSK